MGALANLLDMGDPDVHYETTQLTSFLFTVCKKSHALAVVDHKLLEKFDLPLIRHVKEQQREMWEMAYNYINRDWDQRSKEEYVADGISLEHFKTSVAEKLFEASGHNLRVAAYI